MNTQLSVTALQGPAALVVCKLNTASEWRQDIHTRILDRHRWSDVGLRMLLDSVDDFERNNPGRSSERGVLASPLVYSCYNVNAARPPRHYATVGWLDETGYRHAQPALPLPTQDFLTAEWETLLEIERLYAADPKTVG